MRLCFARFAVLMLMGVVTGFKVETACGAPAGSPLKVGQLRCEYLENPLGIGETAPRLSWLLIDPARNAGQSAYQIQVASTEKLLTAGTADLWDTEQVKSPETIQIEYAGKPLVSRETCYWRVRSWDRTGQPSAWSEPAHWEMGLLDAKDWDAKWIRGKAAVDSNNTLTIISATYQAQDGSISKDVTDLLRGMVHNNVLETSVTNENLGGDPAYNKVKQLHLRYSLGTATTDEVLNEKAPLNIPTRWRPCSGTRLDRLSQAHSISSLRRNRRHQDRQQRHRRDDRQRLVCRAHWKRWLQILGASFISHGAIGNLP
jgi:hypothetical protein